MTNQQFPDNVPESVLLAIARVLLPDFPKDLSRSSDSESNDSEPPDDA
ncbi:hypothetical protein [Agathobaculum sp. Marseille-P7918]